MRIDLHTHSTFSDGTNTPTELLWEARQAGVSILGLTDHDTIAGWDEAERAVADAGISLVRGMEISTKYEQKNVHLLAFLFNPQDEQIQTHITTMADNRQSRAQRIVELLSRDYPIDFRQVREAFPYVKTLGRPHIADVLVAKGIFPDRSTAFTQALHASLPYYVSYGAPDTVQAIKWVVNAGGRAVLAHPRANSRGKIVSAQAIADFADAGLYGLEIDHRENTDMGKQELIGLAKALDLARFGASDFHGRGKPNMLGENLTASEVYLQLISGTYLEVLTP